MPAELQQDVLGRQGREPEAGRAGLGEVGGRIQLKLCNAGTGYTLWVRAGNRLVNVERSDAINAPAYLCTLSLNNASLLHVGPARGYYRWALQQCCNP
jgi:hypothetical protein